MNSNQIELYKSTLARKVTYISIILAIGLAAECYSIYVTYTNKEIVEQGAIPALIAIVCISIYVLSTKRINKRRTDLENKNYSISSIVIKSIHKELNKWVVEVEDTGEIVTIEHIIGIAHNGDTVKIIHWQSDNRYEIIQDV